MARWSPEPWGAEAVPVDARRTSTGGLFAIWYGAGLGLVPIGVGTVGAARFVGLGWWVGLLAIVVGTVLAAAAVGLLAVRGARTGVPQMAAGRGIFGRSIVVPAVVSWAGLLGWAAVYAILGGQAVASLSGGVVAPWLGVLLVGLLEGLVAGLGFPLLARFQALVALVQTVLFLVLTFLLAGHVDLAARDGVTASPGSFVLMVAIAGGLTLAWAVTAADYARHVRPTATPWAVFGATFLGLALPAIWLQALGLAVTRAMLPGDDPVQALVVLLGGGLPGAVGAFASGLGVISANGMLLYSAALAALASGVRASRAAVATAGAELAVIVAATALFLSSQAWLENVLLVVGYWVAAWAAVVLATRAGRHDEAVRAAATAGLRMLPWGWRALVALALGTAAGVLFMDQALFMGPGAAALAGADAGYLAAFIVGGLVCLILERARPTPAMAHAGSSASGDGAGLPLPAVVRSPES